MHTTGMMFPGFFPRNDDAERHSWESVHAFFPRGNPLKEFGDLVTY